MPSNINHKTYAMNAITPQKWWKTWIVRLIFFILGKFPKTTTSLVELSFIHFARWVIVPRRKFPHVDPEQP
ncbi:MAG TPA: hypothetical protein VFR24_20870, partial [Candidatus Angelobacter sp.]|nr:hypothetical protein [Candidatus Angelobacter sp.]